MKAIQTLFPIHKLALTFAGFLIAVATSNAADGTWTSTAGGSWTNTANWSGGNIADGSGSSAFFNTLDLTADAAITLDAARTISNVTFSDTDSSTAANWTLSTSTLTLGTAPVITVSNLNAASAATISSILAGPTGPIIRGNSRLNLTGANTFTNPIVDGGIVAQNLVNSLGVNATNNVITLTNGGTLLRSASITVNSGLNVRGTNTYQQLTGAGGNWNGMVTGDGVLQMNLGGIQLTMGGNNAWNSNVWANFTGTVILSGGGNLRFDANNSSTVTLGSKFATFDLGATNNAMNERGASGIAVHTTYLGALKGGPLTTIAANGTGGTTNTFQIGDANLSTTFDGRINNGTITAVTKSGSGTLTLNHTNGYTGVTTIQAGTLKLAPFGRIANSPVVTVVSNATFDISAGTFDGVSTTNIWTPVAAQTVGGHGAILGSITMAAGTLSPGVGTNFGTLTMTGDLIQDTGATNRFKAGGGTNDQISITGNLTFNNSVVVLVTPPAGLSVISDGTYPLFKWTGTLTGDTNNIALQYSAQPGTLQLVTNLVAKTISLQVAGAAVGNLTWKGDGVANLWNHSSLNWSNGVTVSAFTDADNITFNDLGSNTPNIDLVDINQPGSMVVSNITKDYVLSTSGAGKISGLTALTKNGTGKLTLATDNDYSGATAINNGTLQIGNGGTAGTWAGAMNVGAAGVLAHNRSDDVTVAGGIAGTGGLLHNGAGALILTANSTFSGKATNSGGTLQLGNGTGVSGSLAGEVNVGAANLLRYYYTGGDVIIGNTISGTGTVLYDLAAGNRTYTIPVSTMNTNFAGTNVINAGVRLHASDGNFGYILGNGGAVNATALGSQVWLDRSSNAYNQNFILSGTGWTGDATPLGAMRIFGCTVSGPVTLVGDARVGGSINGGLITGPVSGNYQLEVLGNTNSFILSLSNSANAWGNTLITSGAIRSLANGSVSTNAMTIDATGDLQCFGTTVAVNSLNNGGGGAGTVRNVSSATAGTLVVGADGTSTAFDGFFSDGGSRALNLTKVGSGTLTLSAASTNTGTVSVSGGTLALTGSGSFGNASVINVGSGAFYDVSAAGGTLTLNSGQTLSGKGTVTGIVSASAGSTVAPGSSIGTLTASGNITLAGLTLMEIDQTNTPSNCDKLLSSGGSVTGGGTLTVTNIGPALVAGTTFQLFAGAISGFSAVNLPLTDAATNTYTWTNKLSLNGSVQVLTVTPPAAPINPAPTNIISSVSGGNLTLLWASDHTGWTLQAQTNARSIGLSNNWVTFDGGYTTTNTVSIPIGNSQPTVFFRLFYQVP